MSLRIRMEDLKLARRGGEKLGDLVSSHQDLPYSSNMKVRP